MSISDTAHSIGTCQECGTTGPLHAQELCPRCYARWIYHRSARYALRHPVKSAPAPRTDLNQNIADWTKGANDAQVEQLLGLLIHDADPEAYAQAIAWQVLQEARS